MSSVRLMDELLLKVPTRVGLLADITEALADAGVNILAIGAYDKDGMGEFLLITNDNPTAVATLGAFGGELSEAEVVVAYVDDEPGVLARLARTIADAGINISQVHATTGGSGRAMIVLRTADDRAVMRLLNGA